MTPPSSFNARGANVHKPGATSDAKKTWERAGGGPGEDRSAGGGGSDTESTSSSSSSRPCPYELLGIQSEATDAWIRSAYRKASLQVHPDRCPDDPTAASRFRELTKAKDLLLDPLRRRIYDVNHGHQAKRVAVNPQWWSDWDTIFAELCAPGDEDDSEAVGASSLPPENPLPLTRELLQADVLIVGATGLTGTLACMVMQANRCGHTWAIAGRDGRKLGSLEAKFGRGPLYRGSLRLGSKKDIQRAVKSARVVVDLTGPSWSAGFEVAEACVKAGRHYVDNTTEVHFSKELKDKLHSSAKASGSCMVVHSGDTATVADFGTWALARHFKEQHKVSTRKIDLIEWCTAYCISGSEHLSGGFVGEDTKGVNPFLLGGLRACGVREEEKERADPVEDEELGIWCLASAVAERLAVRATCGMLELKEQYGRRFAFRNLVPFLDRDSAVLHQTRSLVAQQRRDQLVQEKKIPPAGHGPGERKRRERFMNRIFSGTADEFGGKGKPRRAHLVMQYGPGGLADRYEGAATIALETALTLLDAEDSGNKELLRPGWGTPVYHLAHLGFMDRLNAKGLNMKVVEGPPAPELIRNIVNNTMPLKFEASSK